LNKLNWDSNFDQLPKLAGTDLSTNFSRNFRWGGQVGIQSANVRNINGIFAGIFAEYRLNSRWYLSSALRYSYTKYETSIGNGSLDEALSADAGTQDTTGLNDPTGAPNNPYQVDLTNEAVHNILINEAGFHTIQMPLQLGYRLHPKWSIMGGVQLSYIMRGLAQVPADQKFTNVADLSSTRNSTFNYAVDNQIVRRWDLGTTMGLVYQAKKQLSFGLDYNLILFKNKTDLNKTSLQNSALQLKVNYYFK
jgi:long-subunit fatty acid transport protein